MMSPKPLNTVEPTVIEGFCVLKMKQEIQEEIFRETEKMTPEELCEYFRAGGLFLREKGKMEKSTICPVAEVPG